MEKVVIGMSGGVDSSVAAKILKDMNYEVIGVTLKVWQNDNTLAEDNAIRDARSVCKKLGIEYHVIDYSKQFKIQVIDRFAKEYMEGKTPNPCNMCNRYIKFEGLLEFANEIGAKYIATGHYANISLDNDTNRYYIQKSKADKKDQTYALYNLTQEQLSRVIMPLGNYTKEMVRKIAEELELATANRKDSQEICFVPDKDYAGYISKNYGYAAKIGDFIDNTGKIYGKHKGIVNYTVGQRKGLGLSLKQPMYVVKLDKNKNNVIIGLEEELKRDSLECTDLNFMIIQSLDKPLKVKAKIRYNANPESATIIPLQSGNVKVVFDEKVKGVAPGQAVVFYIEDKLLGGGIICQE